jgi:hypothetical protein
VQSDGKSSNNREEDDEFDYNDNMGNARPQAALARAGSDNGRDGKVSRTTLRRMPARMGQRWQATLPNLRPLLSRLPVSSYCSLPSF